MSSKWGEDLKCPICGLVYKKFRTGLTFKEVRDYYWVDTEDEKKWKYKRRHTVLGRWHAIKKDMWAEHLKACKDDAKRHKVPF